MRNDENRQIIKNMIDVMSDGHTRAANKACEVNASLLKLDEAIDQGLPLNIHNALVSRRMDALDDMLRAQEQRVGRVRDELAEVSKRLRV